ncbi:MAG: cupin domain-containing protein [Clostridia bacterium]|nr:cupin domain-containing protein [Clostridia bacterium]
MIIGTKLKALRLKSMLTQEELADRCELTKGYISQLENDLTSPSISTLGDILTALGSTFAEFFQVEEELPLRYKPEDCFEKVTEDSTVRWLVPSNEKLLMEPMRMTLSPNAETERDVPHDGEEFGYVLKGEITVRSGHRKEKIKAGESFYYDCGKPHYIKNETSEDSEFIWVIVGE